MVSQLAKAHSKFQKCSMLLIIDVNREIFLPLKLLQTTVLVKLFIKAVSSYRITGYFRRSFIFEYFEERHSFENKTLRK